MPTPKDAELTQKLKSFCCNIHHEFFGAVEDILMGPQVFLPNTLIKRLCDLVHVHALQSLSVTICNVPELAGVGGKMVRCISHLWRLVSVIGIRRYYHRSRIPS